jgi:hypothetical protein
VIFAAITVFGAGILLGAWWGISVYPRLKAREGPQYAIQYQEGEWLWLKDSSRKEVLVFMSESEAKLALDSWLRRNPEYLDHCRVVPWNTGNDPAHPSESESRLPMGPHR